MQPPGVLVRLIDDALRASGRDLGALLADPELALSVPPARDRDRWSASADGPDPFTVQGLFAAAQEDRTRPWPLPLASAAARVRRDGDRTVWEAPAFARQRRLSRAAAVAAITLDDEWIDEVADGVILLCEQTSWCWPAHDDGPARRGAVLSDPAEPFLDLGAGEVAAQLAWIDHLLGEQLDARVPGVRDRIRAEVTTRVLRPFADRRDWHWIGLDGDVHNWNPWIHGNVLVAALRLVDRPGDAAWRAELVRLVAEGLDRYLAALPDDGAIDEGYGYWWNGACRALEALETLRFATGGRVDAATATPGLRATLGFPHRMHLGGDWYVDVADSQARPSPNQPWHALHQAALRAGDDDARRHAASHRRADVPVSTEAEGLGRLLHGLTDRDWRDAASAEPPLPRDSWLPSVQLLVARENDGRSDGLTIAVKGGSNGEHHNHNDVGSFILASDGVPVVIDPGRATYTAASFGPDRYAQWAMRSDWHNVPEIAGMLQAPGAEHRADRVLAQVSREASGLRLDLDAAYPPTGFSWTREVRLERAGAGRPAARAVIDDVWTTTATSTTAAATVIRLLIAGEVRLGESEVIVVPLGDARPVRLTWSCDAEPSTTSRVLDDPLLREVWGVKITRVDFTVRTGQEFHVVAEQQTPIDGRAG